MANPPLSLSPVSFASVVESRSPAPKKGRWSKFYRRGCEIASRMESKASEVFSLAATESKGADERPQHRLILPQQIMTILTERLVHFEDTEYQIMAEHICSLLNDCLDPKSDLYIEPGIQRRVPYFTLSELLNRKSRQNLTRLENSVGVGSDRIDAFLNKARGRRDIPFHYFCVVERSADDKSISITLNPQTKADLAKGAIKKVTWAQKFDIALHLEEDEDGVFLGERHVSYSPMVVARPNKHVDSLDHSNVIRGKTIQGLINSLSEESKDPEALSAMWEPAERVGSGRPKRRYWEELQSYYGTDLYVAVCKLGGRISIDPSTTVFSAEGIMKHTSGRVLTTLDIVNHISAAARHIERWLHRTRLRPQ